jgi:hypothetical protein
MKDMVGTTGLEPATSTVQGSLEPSVAVGFGKNSMMELESGLADNLGCFSQELNSVAIWSVFEDYLENCRSSV